MIHEAAFVALRPTATTNESTRMYLIQTHNATWPVTVTHLVWSVAADDLRDLARTFSHINDDFLLTDGEVEVTFSSGNCMASIVREELAMLHLGDRFVSRVLLDSVIKRSH